MLRFSIECLCACAHCTGWTGLQCCWFDLSISAWNLCAVVTSTNNNKSKHTLFFLSFFNMCFFIISIIAAQVGRERVTYGYLQIYTFFASSIALDALAFAHCSLFYGVNGFVFLIFFLFCCFLSSALFFFG